MPQQVNIPGQGIVNFPDSMNDEQITQAAQRLHSQAAEQSVTAQVEPIVPKSGAQMDSLASREIAPQLQSGVEAAVGVAAKAAPEAIEGAMKAQQAVLNPASLVSDALTPQAAKDVMQKQLIPAEAVDAARRAAQYPAPTLANIAAGEGFNPPQETGALGTAGKFVSEQIAAQTTPENIALIAGTEGLGALEKGLAKSAPTWADVLFGKLAPKAEAEVGTAATAAVGKGLQPKPDLAPATAKAVEPNVRAGDAIGEGTSFLRDFLPDEEAKAILDKKLLERGLAPATAKAVEPAVKAGAEPPPVPPELRLPKDEGAFPGISQEAENVRRADLNKQTQPESEPVGGEPNASQITSPEGVAQPEVRTRVGEETPLRQQGETPEARQGVETPATQEVTGSEPVSEISEVKKMGGGVVQSMYDDLWTKVQKGRTSDPFVAKAQPLYKSGEITGPEDLADFANNRGKFSGRGYNVRPATQEVTGSIRSDTSEKSIRSDTSTGTQPAEAQVSEKPLATPAHPELDTHIKQTWPEASAKADTLETGQPTYRERLARGFLDNPRPAKDFERVSLLRHLDDTESLHAKALDELKSAPDVPTRIDAAMREAEARAARDDAYKALDVSGSESGRSLNAVAMTLNKYKNVERLRTGLEVAQRKPLTRVQEVRIQNISDRIRNAEPTQLVDYSENMSQVINDARNAGKGYKQYMSDLENASKQKLATERGSLKWAKDFDPCV